MTAAAYAHAQHDDPLPFDLVMLSYIDRFGAQSVLGRPLGFGEIQRMLHAENIIKWTIQRNKAENWATWANQNPDKNATLLQCERFING